MKKTTLPLINGSHLVGLDTCPLPKAGRWQVMWPDGRTEDLTVREMNDGRMAVFADAHPDCGRIIDKEEGGLWRELKD